MTRITIRLLAIVTMLSAFSRASGPLSWESRGVGGGGALFSPSINPADEDEFYVACDMGELFHTMDFGRHYATAPFYRIVGGTNCHVCFTSDSLVRYCISHGNDMALPMKSMDAGYSWSKLPGNPDESEETWTINADYDHPQRVIISYYGGIYSSQDGGSSFTLVHAAKDNGAGVIVGGVFFNGDTVFIGSSDGLLVSADKGAHFSEAAVTGISSEQAIFSFAGAKQNNQIRFFCLTGKASDMYVGLVGSDYYQFVQGVYCLDWGSGDWVSKMTGIQSGDFPMFVGMSTSNINIAYLAGSGDAGAPNVLKTTNGGSDWKRTFLSEDNRNVATGWSGAGGDRGWGYGECIYQISVAAFNPDKAVISDMGFVHVTQDGGATWRQAYASSADQNSAGAVTPKRKYYHGIGLENTSCWQVFWADSLNLFAPFTDIGGIRSADAGASWGFDYSGFSANTMYRIAQTPDKTLYAGTSNVHDMYESTRLSDNQLDANDADGAILYSKDKGGTWKTLHTFNHPVYWVAVDPNNPNTLYASVIHSAQGGVFVSTDIQNGASSAWKALPAPPRTSGHPATVTVLKDGKVVCGFSGRRDNSGAFTNSSGVFVYDRSSNTWADVSDPGMYYWTRDVVVDPFDTAQNTWYACVYSGWGGKPNGLGGLYKTSDRGKSWKRINDLDRVGSITINPGNSAEAYLSTETQGLWLSGDFTSSKPNFTLVDNYPFGHPQRVFFDPFAPSEVWVASFGNGMRKSSMNADKTKAGKIASGITRRFSVCRGTGGHLLVLVDKLDKDAPVAITSSDGKAVFSQTISAAKSPGTFELRIRVLRPGVYFATLGGLRAQKLLIVK